MSFEEELKVCACLECDMCGSKIDFVFDKKSLNNFITKQRVKEITNNFFDRLISRRGNQSPDYSLEQIESDLLKELGLEGDEK